MKAKVVTSSMRFRKELHDKIKEAARQNDRPFIAEAALRLEQSFSREDVETMLRRVLKEQAELHYATRNYPGFDNRTGFPRI